MRLTDHTRNAIVRLFRKYFPGGHLYLFGSRVNDQAKGGDIDLLCEQDGDPRTLVEKKLAFLVELDQTIGEQRIDFILYRPSENKNPEFAERAKANGVRLV